MDAVPELRTDHHGLGLSLRLEREDCEGGRQHGFFRSVWGNGGFALELFDLVALKKVAPLALRPTTLHAFEPRRICARDHHLTISLDHRGQPAEGGDCLPGSSPATHFQRGEARREIAVVGAGARIPL